MDLADDVRRTVSGATVHAPFWSMPISSFGTLHMTTFINGSHSLSMPVSHASQPRRCSELPYAISRRHTLSDYGFQKGFTKSGYPLPMPS